MHYTTEEHTHALQNEQLKAFLAGLMKLMYSGTKHKIENASACLCGLTSLLHTAVGWLCQRPASIKGQHLLQCHQDYVLRPQAVWRITSSQQTRYTST
jgi:hypothetical protein